MHSIDRPRVPLIRGVIAVMLLSLLSLVAGPAEAAERQPDSGPAADDVSTNAWTPGLSPFYPAKERVFRNQSGAQRSHLLEECPFGYLCLAAGQGDGRHTVFWLYECPERSVWNFIDAGAVVNHQDGGAVARFKRKDYSLYWLLGADNKIHAIDWRPVWYVDPC